MPRYEVMYLKLFNAITDAVRILEQAQKEAEEIFISSDSIEIFDGKENEFPDN